MSTNLLAQLFGLAGLTLALTIFQVKKRRNMLRISIVACSLYTVQYILLGAYTGATLNIIGGARGYAYYKVSPNRRHLWVLFTFISLAALGAILTWQGPISLLALLGSVCGTFSVWHKNPKYIRRWALLAPPLWFTYNFISGSYPGMIGEVIMLTSNLLGEYRFDLRHPSHYKKRFARTA
jgi:hypothetical protein